MKVNFKDIFSEQEIQVILLKEREGKNTEEIAEALGKSKKHISTVIKRIKNKIKKLEEQNIILDFSETTVELDVDEEIQQIFLDEETRTLRKKLTVKQAIFLQNQSLHSTSKTKKPESQAERQMRNRLGIKKRKNEIIVRKMTEEEKEEFLRRREEYLANRQAPDPNLYKMLQFYEENFGICQDTEEMARIEVNLRAAGLIYRTPYINKLNSKTGICIRASNAGDKVVVIKDEDRHLLPQHAKFVESTIDEDGNKESVWITDNWKKI